MTGRSIARISLFKIAFGGHRNSKRTMWLGPIFSGRECRPRISRGARYDKVARYLANEGERNKFRAANSPRAVIGRRTKIVLGI